MLKLYLNYLYGFWGVAYYNVTVRNLKLGEIIECDGVLGAPAFFENFGFGNNPGLPLNLGQTNYEYKICPFVTSGEYSIVNTTIGCNNDWLGLPNDHTPLDVNGYMMLIDGNDKRGEIFNTQINIVNLVTTTHEFSVFIANLSNDFFEKPKIHFEIYDNLGNIILESLNYQIDYNPNNPWKKISIMVDLPLLTNSITVILVNENNDKAGNDFVIDDISFAPCFVPIRASFSNVQISSNKHICNNGLANVFGS